MNLDSTALNNTTAEFKPVVYKRIFPLPHKRNPLGMGPSKSRFSSTKVNFFTLYGAVSLETAIAEAIVRDRFENGGPRQIFSSELSKFCVTELSASVPLHLVDLRSDGCFQLGVSTDIASAKGWNESCKLAQHIHDYTELDGFLYKSRLTGDNCIAIFQRAVASKFTARKARELSATPHLAKALEQLNVEVIA